jgi:DNA polymerase II large subunit
MNFSRHFSAASRLIRGLAIALVCTLFFLVNAYPALAIGSSQTNPSEGETRLNATIENAEDAVRPENALSSEKVIERANKGLNEVQVDADADQMNRPENSRKATSAAEEVQRALSKAVDKVTGRD